MISPQQLRQLARQEKTNEATVLREYVQLVFLNYLYQQPSSNKIFFKGGTAIHVVLGAPRFSEDLDFTVNLEEQEFLSTLSSVFTELARDEAITWKERKTLTGKRFLLTTQPTVVPYASHINLDFSFRMVSLKKSWRITNLTPTINLP